MTQSASKGAPNGIAHLTYASPFTYQTLTLEGLLMKHILQDPDHGLTTEDAVLVMSRDGYDYAYTTIRLALMRMFKNNLLARVYSADDNAKEGPGRDRINYAATEKGKELFRLAVMEAEQAAREILDLPHV